MKTNQPLSLAILAAAASLAVGGCAQTGRTTAEAPAATPSKSASPAAVPAGMNANGEVIDSKKVSAGSGRQVKGLGGWQGEITGKPAPNSKFTKLQIGMSMRQVTDIVGEPSDRGSYITGKAFIPFYFGSDRHRYEFVYKGEGRLIFAGGSLNDLTGGNLTWIIHNAHEPAYR